MENHHLKVELNVEQADKFDKATEFVIHDNAFAWERIWKKEKKSRVVCIRLAHLSDMPS